MVTYAYIVHESSMNILRIPCNYIILHFYDSLNESMVIWQKYQQNLCFSVNMFPNLCNKRTEKSIINYHELMSCPVTWVPCPIIPLRVKSCPLPTPFHRGKWISSLLQPVCSLSVHPTSEEVTWVAILIWKRKKISGLTSPMFYRLSVAQGMRCCFQVFFFFPKITF